MIQMWIDAIENVWYKIVNFFKQGCGNVDDDNNFGC